jgi:hypothetical protein
MPTQYSAPRSFPQTALDLYAGAGGATRGLQRAGFFVVRVEGFPFQEIRGRRPHPPPTAM